MSRRVYLLGVGLALVALGLAVTDLAMGPRPGVTEANFRRVRPGMTVRQVKALLGEDGRAVDGYKNGSAVWRWRGPVGEVLILFAADGRARTQAGFYPYQSDAPIARLRAWLGW
jgi:hypothetical protein